MEKLLKYKYQILGLIVGGIAGYLYWHFWACENGCTITSVWWRTTLFGSLYGWIISDAIVDWTTKRKIKQAGEGITE